MLDERLDVNAHTEETTDGERVEDFKSSDPHQTSNGRPIEIHVVTDIHERNWVVGHQARACGTGWKRTSNVAKIHDYSIYFVYKATSNASKED
jgi:hypothetical protein